MIRGKEIPLITLLMSKKKMNNREDLISLDNAKVASITLVSKEESPWHYHTEVIENIICLSGGIRLETRNPEKNTNLKTGERYLINPKQEHRLVNTGNSDATYLLVQNGNYDFISSNS